MKYKIKYAFIFLIALTGIAGTFSSCKYQKVDPANYPGQKIYMSTADAAVNGPNGNGIFTINAVAVPGQTYNYIIDLVNAKLQVPLGVIRAGVTLNGDINVAVSAKTDTVTKLIASGKLPSDAQVLPANAFTLSSSVTVPDGSSSVTFPISVDLNFLLNHPNTRYSIAVSIASSQVAVNSLLATTIILIDTQFLIPVAGFTAAPDPSVAKKINFTNTSVNGVSYLWDFGDGSTIVTDKSTSHVYTASGTYSVKLTVIGAIGDANKSTITANVTIP